ncbi:MAG: hypothetical protein LBU22_01750 [Dysgonamonadaceae bacterium]|jgi:hypothetical protein|nr:hypothetical protein [Dysgonamonadaceae bacterium]
MNRLIFLWTALSVSLSINAREALILENNLLKAEFDVKNGSLIQLVNKATGWKIVDRASLGQSFELLVPLSDTDIRFNVVKGIEQKPPVIEKQTGGIVFNWSGLSAKDMKEVADITFKGIVCLTENGLEYSGEVINNSPYPVEYVAWPFLGEVSIPDKNQPFYHSTRSDAKELFPHFSNEHGYWGVDYPTSTSHLPEHAFASVHNREQGFIVYGKGNFPTNLIINSFELIPGFELRNTNPYSDEMDGQAVRIQFKSNQVIYNQSGEKTILNPVHLALYKGSLYSGITLFKKAKSVSVFNSPEWIQDPLTWQNISINNGNELINYAKEGVKFGVDVLLVRGWYRESNGNLQEVPGMKEAIDECHKTGIRVVLATNWTAANKRLTIYKQELNQYLMLDPFGISYNNSFLCPLSKRVQEKVIEEWSALQSLRLADGVINADNNHSDKSYLCFAHNHDHRYGEPTVNGTMDTDVSMAEIIRGYGKESKVVLGFGFMDMQNLMYDGYQISSSAPQFSKHRCLNPATPILSTVDVRNARRDINFALLNRFNISYELQFQRNHLEDYPHITAYGRNVKSFRNQYGDYIWDAECIGPVENLVEGNDLSHAMYISKKNGKKSVVVVNTSTNQSSFVTLKTNAPHNFVYASPENPAMQPYHGSLEVQPQSVILFLER